MLTILKRSFVHFVLLYIGLMVSLLLIFSYFHVDTEILKFLGLLFLPLCLIEAIINDFGHHFMNPPVLIGKNLAGNQLGSYIKHP